MMGRLRETLYSESPLSCRNRSDSIGFYSGMRVVHIIQKDLVGLVAAIVITVAIAAAVPAVIVRDRAAIAIPVACKVLLAIMTGLNPARAGESGTSPISVVPLIMIPYRVPVAADPEITRSGTSWLNPHDSWAGRRPDSHS
jgi:hypothetical protein